MSKFLSELSDYTNYYENLLEQYYIHQIIKGYMPLIITVIVTVAAVFITRYAVKAYAREKAKYIDYDYLAERTAQEVIRREIEIKKQAAERKEAE